MEGCGEIVEGIVRGKREGENCGFLRFLCRIHVISYSLLVVSGLQVWYDVMLQIHPVPCIWGSPFWIEDLRSRVPGSGSQNVPDARISSERCKLEHHGYVMICGYLRIICIDIYTFFV
jgi:hypothetical protein